MAEVDTSLEELLECPEWHAKTTLLFLLPPPSSGRRTCAQATRGRRETCLFARQSIAAAREFETRVRPRGRSASSCGGREVGRWCGQRAPVCRPGSRSSS